MKKVILLLLLLPHLAAGQVFDSFETGLSGNWVQSVPQRWSADSAGALSGRYSLHHSFDNPESGTDRIGIPVANLHPGEGVTRWSFLVRHGYDPSSSNNWSLYLFSDAGPALMSADATMNGFAIGVNLTGYDDSLRLWKIKGNLVTIVVNCHVNWQTEVGTADPVMISVERYENGNWIVNICHPDGKVIRSSAGNDPELFESSWFGISYRYSSTHDRQLWIDDISIEGVFYIDTIPPAVTGHMIKGRRSVEVRLDEEPSDQFNNPENFYLNSKENKPVSVRSMNELTFILEFNNDLINKALNRLVIDNICDEKGNCRKETMIEFTPVWAETGDVVITEIMADPMPVVSLPGKEYIELTNRSSFTIDVLNWKLCSGEQVIKMPSFQLISGEIKIVCSVLDTALFNEFGNVCGINQFPSLADNGKLLCLVDSSGILVHGVEYSDKWYGNELKSDGGWSLEMIDASFPFHYEGNWKASTSRKGGTPGTINSVSGVNADRTFSGIQNVFPGNSRIIKVSFSEPVKDFTSIKSSIIEGGPDIADIYPSDILLREFDIHLSSSLEKGVLYMFQLPAGISDFAGNKIVRSSSAFGLTETPTQGDILFNEILFNPFPGDPDFIELHNCSDKVIDASRLNIVSINESISDTSVMIPVSGYEKCILPGAYYVITTDMNKIIERYFSSAADNIFEVSSLPSMPDDEGTLLLLSSELDILDKISYNEKMHYSLLFGFEGISLEKIGKCSSSGEAVNWHSATENSGWGTPGKDNSVFVNLTVGTKKVNLSSTRLTPDNDGSEDFLTVSLTPGGIDNVVSLSVYDETGGLVRKIASNMLTGAEVTFIWDGTADDGTPVNSGIYIVLITIFDDKGKVENWKKVCAVLR